MSIKCKLLGHDYRPYRHSWVEFLPNRARPDINRDGAYTLTHVYCKRCGLIRKVELDGNNVRYSKV